MSKLDELIRELCPNGVENKKLGDIATISRGGNFQKNIETVTAYITEKGLAESSAKLMGKGTTLIALVGATIGKVACW